VEDSAFTKEIKNSTPSPTERRAASTDGQKERPEELTGEPSADCVP